jgi:hypothetical protein
VTEEQRLQLQDLLTVAEGNRSSRLDQLRPARSWSVAPR